MAHRIRYIMVGGFLGAGKTTTLARLARSYVDQGLNVGIVTNDQADDLVDTNLLRSQGFHVGEVTGACLGRKSLPSLARAFRRSLWRCWLMILLADKPARCWERRSP